MMAKARVAEDGQRVTVRVPISVQRRGGRKLVLTPHGEGLTGGSIPPVDSALVKAIARAFRWREMLESGEFSSIRDIAKAEKINESYVARILRLTLLSPGIVEAIVGGQQRASIQLKDLLQDFSIVWRAQGALMAGEAKALAAEGIKAGKTP